MANYNLIPLRDLSRGVDLRSSESNVADGYCEDLQNVITVSSGQLQKRPGYQGYAGYVPMRVREVTHDGYQINFSLDTGIDLTGVTSSPIIVYGKYSQAESGDFSTTAALKYYAGFSVDVRDVFSVSATTVTKEANDTGAASNDLFVYTMASTSETDNSNTWVQYDGVDVDASTFAATVTYTPPATERVFIAVIDKAAEPGSSYVEDYSAFGSAGTITDTVAAGTHGLGNFNIIPKFYTLSGGVYTEFIPDSFTVGDTSGDATFSFTHGSAYTGSVILSVAPADNFKQKTVSAGATDTIQVTSIDGSFPYWALYRLSGTDWELVQPDSVVVDDSADTLTVSITNASASPETYEFYYDYATLRANTIRVVDSGSVTTSYTGTTISDPQLTIWGINHDGLYDDDDTTGGHVLHLDSYKRESEARLVAGLGGNLYAARTRSEVGTTYSMPQLTSDLDARINTAVSMAPLFQTTGTSSSVRTRGIITGDNVANGYAVVTGVAYVSSGVADYTVSLTSKAGTLAMASQISTSDYLTVTGMGHTVHNGTFKISAVPTQDSSSVTIRVANASLLTSDFDETGAAGSANVFTDQFTTTTSTNWIDGDIIAADSISSSLTLTVKAVSTTTVTVDGVTATVGLAQGVSVLGKRTSYVQPLQNSSNTASVASLVRGDMVTLTNYLGETLERQPRIVAVHPYQDMDVSLTIASGTATVSLGGSFTVSSVNTGTDLFTTSAAHGFAENDPVIISTTGALPTGLRSDVVYFVDLQSSDTFKIMAKEDGTVIDLASSGSGTITVQRVHRLSVGQRVTISQTTDADLDGVVTVVSVPSVNSFTFATSSSASSATGVLVGRTAEFDESLTFSSALGSTTTVTVSDRWIPIEAPTVTGNLPETTYVSYFDDDDTRLRSCIVAGNMYLTNQADELMKFDGTSLYQAGLFRWQPYCFAQVDTGTASLTLDAVSAAGTANCQNTNKFTLTTAGDAFQFVAGDRIVHSSADSAIYTVQSVSVDDGIVYTTTAISSNDTAWTIQKVKTYRYYFRLNAIDANNNVIASAATGAEDCIVELSANGQIRLRLIGMPAWGVYDYDRLELSIFRTIADTPGVYYKVRTTPVTFSAGYNYIDIYDGTTDESLLQSGDEDTTMVALLGGELGTAWEQPPRAKYLTTVNNRLVLANIKDYQQLDITMRKQAAAASVTVANLDTFTFLFRKDSTDTSTTTNMVDRATYEFVDSGAVTIDPSTDIARDATTFTITETSHGLVVGNWVYLFHAAAGADNDLHFAGWYQIASKTDDTFTFNFANSFTPSAADVDRYVTATTKTNIPVWLGTDGNYNNKYGNDSGSYERLAAIRLANAINASMVTCDTAVSGQTTFVPWLTAHAGGEYGVGQVVVRQPKYASDTMEVVLGTIPTNVDLYVNNVKRASSAQVSANSLLFPSRVLISYENHPETFDAPTAALQEDSDSVVDVNSADGEEIIGVVPFFGESAFGGSQVESLVVVFKTNSVYLLDVKTRAVQKIDSQGLGCTAPYSIAPTRNGIMFANLSGVYRLNRNLTISYVGKFVERYWRDTVNAAQLSLATGHNYGIGRQYKLSVPIDDDTANSVVLVYDHTREGQDQELGAWTKFTNHPATGWANLDDDSYFASSTGQVFKIRQANDSSDFRDDAEAVDTMVILLKAMDAGLPGLRKRAQVVGHMRMDKSDVTATMITAAVDLSTEFSAAGTISATLGAKKGETFVVSLPVPKFTYLQLKFTNAVKDENFVLAGIDLYVASLTIHGVKDREEMS